MAATGKSLAGPLLARALLRRLLPVDLRDDVLHDLGEHWVHLRRHRGLVRATSWYWRQAARSMMPSWRHERGDRDDDGRGTGTPLTPHGGPTRQARNPRSREHRFAGVARDLRHAVRQVRRTPSFTTAVVVTMALGIGATSAVFSVVNGVLLQPLPYAGADRLVRLYSADEATPEEANVLSGNHYIAYRERDDIFADLAGFFDYNELGADLIGDGDPERVVRLPVTANYFRVLGVPPAAGNVFARDQEIGTDAGVALISHGLWTRRYGGAADAIGATLLIDGEPFVIVGVAPRGFVGPNGRHVDVWTPMDMRPDGPNNFDNHYLSAVGRLADGVSTDQARQAIEALNVTLTEQDSTARLEYTHVVPLLDDIVGEARPMLSFLMGSVGLVLLIVCANVANLFLMHGSERVGELAVRAALGAGRARLMAQLLAEGLLRAFAGGALGLALGWGAVRALMAMAPDNLPRADLVGLDARVVAFVLLTTLLSGTLLVIAPAARLSRQRPTGVLQSESRSATGTGLQRRVRSTLVVTEVAMALALLVAAGGLMAAFVELQRSELGIDPRGVETFEVNLPATSYAKGERRVGFSRRLLDSIEQMPGIDAAGAVTVLPVTGRSFLWGFFGKDHPQGERPLLVDVRIVDGDFFGALGMELAAGRTFEASDFGADTPPVLIANRHLVERYLGESFRLGDEARLAGVARRIVGVVSDAAVDARGTMTPAVYLPYGQMGFARNWAMTYVVKGSGDVALLPALQAAVAAIDPERVVYRPSSMQRIAQEASADVRFSTLVMGVFAALALMITAVGIYGVLAVSVSQRTRELGIRAALGAEAGELRALVLAQAMRLAGLGVVCGLGLVLAGRAWIGTFVPLPELAEPRLLATVVLVLIGVALAAGYLPARRATSVQPTRALQ